MRTRAFAGAEGAYAFGRQVGGNVAGRISSAFVKPTVQVSPADNVWSYHMFLSPTESVKHSGACTCDRTMAYVMVILVLLVQAILLAPIYDEVVKANDYLQDRILLTGEKFWSIDPHRAWALLLNEDDHFCVEPSYSLCTMLNDSIFEHERTITCAPPSIRLLQRWDMLDTNGDGKWTYEEAKASSEELTCSYGVDPTEAFDVVANFVRKRRDHLWVHPDLLDFSVIHRAYFDYALGDILMCGYRDQELCPNLLERGVFEAPLTFGNVPRVGSTAQSALEYCYELLKPNGVCESIMPSSYTNWKVMSQQECGEPVYDHFVYEHPVQQTRKSLLTADFTTREEFAQEHETHFFIYKTIIIALWLFAMVHSAKDIFIVWTWIWRFPAARHCEERGEEPVDVCDTEDGRKEYIINGITWQHRTLVCIISGARTIMLICLTRVGTSLLLNSRDLMDLIFDAVSLVFVLELAQILYAQVLRKETRDQTESLRPMQVETVGLYCVTRVPGLSDGLLLVGVIGVALVIQWKQDLDVVRPLEDALACTCLGEGRRCMESRNLNADFWFNYWKEVLPRVVGDAAQLMDEFNRTHGNTVNKAPAIPTEHRIM